MTRARSKFDEYVDTILEKPLSSDDIRHATAFYYAGDLERARTILRREIRQYHRYRFSRGYIPQYMNYERIPFGFMEPKDLAWYGQLRYAIYINLCRGDPQIALKYYDWAQKNLADREFQNPDSPSSDWETATSAAWRGYALFMLGIYDEAHELLSSVRLIGEKDRGKGHGSLITVRVEFALSKFLLPLCAEMANSDTSRLKSIAESAGKEYLKTLPELNVRVDGYLYFFHIMDYVDTICVSGKIHPRVMMNPQPAYRHERIGDDRLPVLIRSGRNLANGDLGPYRDFVSFVQWCRKTGTYPELARIEDLLISASPFDPVPILVETTQLLSQPGIPPGIREIADVLYSVAEHAHNCGVLLIPGYDTEICDSVFPTSGSADTPPDFSPGKNLTAEYGIENPGAYAERLAPDLNSESYPVFYNATSVLVRLGRPAIPALVTVLREGTPSGRRNALEALAGIAEPEAVETVISNFASPDEERRFFAASNLAHKLMMHYGSFNRFLFLRDITNGSLKERDLFALLVSELSNTDARVRAMNAYALGELCAGCASGALVTTLSDTDPSTRIEAAIALGKMGDRRSIGVLKSLFAPSCETGFPARKGSTSTISERRFTESAVILGGFGEPDGIRDLIGMLSSSGQNAEKAADLLAALGSPSVDPLIITVLSPAPDEMRLRAAYTLARCKDPRAIPLFEKLLGDPASAWQAVAIRGLAACNATTAIPGIREKLNAGNDLVQWEAAVALVELGAPDATEIIVDAIRKISIWQKSRYLSAIDTRDSVKMHILTTILEKNDKRWDKWKAESLRILTTIHDPSAIDYAISCLHSHNPVLRKQAIVTMGTTEDPRIVEPLISCISDPDPESVFRSIRSLGKTGDSRAVEPITRLAENPHPRIRECVAEALGRIGDPRSAPVLIRLLADSHSYVRQTSTLALATAGSTDSVGPLLIALNDTSMLVRKNAATALGQIRDTRAFLPLTERLKDLMPGVRSAAARALGMLGDGRASGYLIPLLHDRIGFVRAEAVRSLGMLGDETCIPALEDVVKTDPGRDEWGVPVAVTARDVLSGIKNRGGTDSEGREKPGNSGNPHLD